MHSVVFASAVPPFLAHLPGKPDGPLEESLAAKMAASLTANQDAFYDDFVTQFFSVDGVLVVSEEERQAALALAAQASKVAALQAMAAFAHTDFREDLPKIEVPTLVIHGDGDATVPFEGSGKRTHEAIPQSELHIVAGGPHGINSSHPDEFNRVLIEFLAK